MQNADEMQNDILRLENEVKNQREKLDLLNRKLRDKEQQFNELRAAHNNVCHSVSYRLGRALTWFPRKMRAVFIYIKKHSRKYIANKILGKRMKKILPKNLSEINRIFRENVLGGYKLYAKIVMEYGVNTNILFCALKGTGDYYISGRYLREWLEKNYVTKWIFLTGGKAERQTTELFSIYFQHTKEITMHELRYLRVFQCFVNMYEKNIVNFHHQVPQPFNLNWNLTNSNLMGFRGLNMVDFYLFCGFQLDGLCKESPVFEQSTDKITQIFTNNHLIEGKTVLLSPYSTGNRKNQMSAAFWEYIASVYTDEKYTVCTNCAGEEKPITGTIPIFIPYTEIVPFLNRAGVFIGIRSGLCDIISTSICKKIIIHTYKAGFWPDGNSIAYTGLNNMGLCEDAIELTYTKENERIILEKIIDAVME